MKGVTGKVLILVGHGTICLTSGYVLSLLVQAGLANTSKCPTTPVSFHHLTTVYHFLVIIILLNKSLENYPTTCRVGK